MKVLSVRLPTIELRRLFARTADLREHLWGGFRMMEDKLGIRTSARALPRASRQRIPLPPTCLSVRAVYTILKICRSVSSSYREDLKVSNPLAGQTCTMGIYAIQLAVAEIIRTAKGNL